jgi:hypothetical protein
VAAGRYQETAVPFTYLTLFKWDGASRAVLGGETAPAQ